MSKRKRHSSAPVGRDPYRALERELARPEPRRVASEELSQVRPIQQDLFMSSEPVVMRQEVTPSRIYGNSTGGYHWLVTPAINVGPRKGEARVLPQVNPAAIHVGDIRQERARLSMCEARAERRQVILATGRGGAHGKTKTKPRGPAC